MDLESDFGGSVGGVERRGEKQATQSTRGGNMRICDFLEFCNEAMDVELVDIKTGEVNVIDTEVFIHGGDNDEYYDDIVSKQIRGWNIKLGRLVIEY